MKKIYVVEVVVCEDVSVIGKIHRTFSKKELLNIVSSYPEGTEFEYSEVDIFDSVAEMEVYQEEHEI